MATTRGKGLWQTAAPQLGLPQGLRSGEASVLELLTEAGMLRWPPSPAQGQLSMGSFLGHS